MAPWLYGSTALPLYGSTTNHGNMPPFYMYTQEKKYKVIGDKSVEV